VPNLYSTLLVTEPDYGERVIRVHSGLHNKGVSYTEGVDLVTGERVRMPISTNWVSATQRDVRIAAEGWSWRPVPLPDAEKRAGLAPGSLPAYNPNTRTDLWADHRMRSPAFIALLTLLTDHPEIIFYEVDWRCWVHEQQPRESLISEDSPRLTEPQQPAMMGAGRHAPYSIGGSGDMERYASGLTTHLAGATSPAVVQADEVHDALSDAVLADLLHDYHHTVEWQRRPESFRRLHSGSADMPIVRSLTDVQALIGWTAEALAELDDIHEATRERLAEETAPYRPQGVALALF
jgi:hypothetical protein